jgi:hypothetical protein
VCVYSHFGAQLQDRVGVYQHLAIFIHAPVVVCVCVCVRTGGWCWCLPACCHLHPCTCRMRGLVRCLRHWSKAGVGVNQHRAIFVHAPVEREISLSLCRRKRHSERESARAREGERERTGGWCWCLWASLVLALLLQLKLLASLCASRHLHACTCRVYAGEWERERAR